MDELRMGSQKRNWFPKLPKWGKRERASFRIGMLISLVTILGALIGLAWLYWRFQRTCK